LSNYVQSTNFATKDTLSSGDPLKIVKGTEINTEFNNIATAVATKADSSSIPSVPSLASTGEAQAGTDNTKIITPLRMREGFNASGTAPVFAARAWLNLNGQGGATIRASGNVSSVTYFGEGSYVVNFATAMEDANYSASAAAEGTGGFAFRTTTCSQYTTTALNVRVGTVHDSPPQGTDNPTVSMTVFR
jgi:hypothetical protein